MGQGLVSIIKICRHIYEYVNSEECPFCGKFTHEINWQEIHEQHRDWINSGKSVAQGWWSI